MLWSAVPSPDEWAGATYQETAIAIVPFAFAVSVVVAISFQRERVPVAGGAPVGETERSRGPIRGGDPSRRSRQRHLGLHGMASTRHRRSDARRRARPHCGGALQVGELAQPVALTVLAVAIGAALGRRTPTLVSAVPLLFVLWLSTSFYWLLGDRRVTPFSIVQVQPVRLYAGPISADPLEFPTHWLLEAPGEFSQQWTRAFVSDGLAWWHAVWLLGLALLWLAVALPRPARRFLIVLGATLAVLGVSGQYVVLP